MLNKHLDRITVCGLDREPLLVHHYQTPLSNNVTCVGGGGPKIEEAVMYRQTLVVLVILFSIPSGAFGQTVTLGGAVNVASAEDFATRVLQDPWDMNERTDFGGFLSGSDPPLPDLTNVSFSGGVFSATTGPSANVFLLETRNPNAASLGKTGANFPIDANTYRLLAVRMNATSPGYGVLAWNRDNLWDPTFTYTNNVNFQSLPVGARTCSIFLRSDYRVGWPHGAGF